MKHSIKKTILILSLFAILGFLIYSNTLEAPFVFDDVIDIQRNHNIRLTEFSLGQILKAGFNSYSSSRPVSYISLGLNYYFHQFNVAGYHVVNIIIHILSGILLYFFINTTLNITGYGIRDVRYAIKQSTDNENQNASGIDHPASSIQSSNPSLIAFFAALLWLVNPVHTQSITYITQRMNSMAAMFCVLSMFLYAKGRIALKPRLEHVQSEEVVKSKRQSSKDARQTSIRYHLLWFAGSALAGMLALGCKQIAGTLPFFIFIYEWYFFQNLSKDWIKQRFKYVYGVLIVFGLISFIYLGSDPWRKILSITDFANKEFTFSERLLTEFRVVIYYLGLLFYPHPSRLMVDYDYPLSHSLIDPITTLLSLSAIIGLIGLAIYIAKRERLISFCILWFFGNLMIESSIIPVAIIFEHRTYLPSMLVFLAIVMLAFRYIRQKLFVTGILCVTIIVFSIWTYQRNEVWKDSISLWSDNVEKVENKARPRINLASAFFQKGELEDALFQYSEALRIKPEYADAHYGMGLVLFAQEKIDEAIRQYLKALKIRPRYSLAHYNIGNALAKKGDLDEARIHYLEALRTKPNHAESHYGLGIVLFDMGRINEAIGHFYEALRLNPDYAEPHNNIGIILKAQGRLDEAIDHFFEAIRINPDYAKAHHNLGIAFVYKGRFDEAIKHFSEAVRINPDYAEAHNNLGVVMQEKGMLKEAAKHYAEALRINPDYTDARDTLEQISQ